MSHRKCLKVAPNGSHTDNGDDGTAPNDGHRYLVGLAAECDNLGWTLPDWDLPDWLAKLKLAKLEPCFVFARFCHGYRRDLARSRVALRGDAMMKTLAAMTAAGVIACMAFATPAAAAPRSTGVHHDSAPAATEFSSQRRAHGGRSVGRRVIRRGYRRGYYGPRYGYSGGYYRPYGYYQPYGYYRPYYRPAPFPFFPFFW